MNALSLTFRRWHWWLTVFLRKHRLVIVLGIIAGVLVMVNATRIQSLMPSKKTQYIGRVGAFTLSELPLDIQGKVSQGLTQVTENDQVLPDLAQSMDVSEDGRTYSFTLRPDVLWSDGSALTSADIQLELADVEIQTPTPHSITFKLNDPFTPFPVIVTQPLLKRTSSGKFRKKTIIVGTKDLRITDVGFSGQILNTLTLDSPGEKIIYRFYGTEEEALVAFKLGKIDVIEKLSSPQLTQWPNVEIIEETTDNRYLSLFYNTADSSLQNKTVRQMLAYATPKRTDEQRVISPIGKNSWVYNPQVKPYDHNLETAKSMLERLKQGSNNFELNLTLTTTPAYADMANQIINSWQQIGITTQLRIVAFPDPNDYQVLLIGQQIPDDPDQYLLWHSTQATNITKYQNPKIDKLLEDGRKESDPEKRKQIYQEFQRFLVEDSPAAFLHQLNTYTLRRE